MAIFSLIGFSCLAGVIGASQLGKTLMLGATEVNTWKHFAAIMPTETEKGIREYWTDCVGGAPRFTAPEGIVAADATLTDEQKNFILNNAGDERLIPTLSEIKRSVAKGYDGKSSNQGYDVNTAHNYIYLDDATKATVTGANETNIVNAYDAYNARFTMMDTPLITGPQYSFVTSNVTESYVDGYGYVNEILSGRVDTGWLSFKYVDSIFDLSDYESVSFSIYNPTDASWNNVWVMETNWTAASKIVKTIGAHSWGEITLSKSWFDTHTDSKFDNWWLGIINYTGYDSAAETIKITKPVAKKSSAAAAEFDEIVNKISSVSSPTMADAYYIGKAGNLLANMSDGAKALSAKLSDYNTAKANCSYSVAGIIDASSFAYTDGWEGGAAVANNVADSVYGEVLKIDITTVGGAIESSLTGITVDTSLYDTVSFYVKTDWKAKFTLSKNNWWGNAYDFSIGDWTSTGDTVQFWVDSSSGWTLCTMSAENFNLCKYYSFLNNSADGAAVGKSFYISPIYVSNSAQ